jgi:integrase
MSYCWIEGRRRGRKRRVTYYLHFAKHLGRRPESLRTSDRARAREVQRRVESDLWCGQYGIKRRAAARIRYSDLVRRFTEHKRAAGVNPKTLKNYLRTLNHFGTFLQSDLYVDAVTPELLEAFILERRKAPRRHGEGTLLPKSIRNEVMTLASLFHWAAERDLVLEDPMRKVTKPHRVVYDAPRALTPEQYLALKDAIKNRKFSDIVDLYLLTGMRRSEGLLLTSENVHFGEKPTITIPQPKQGTHRTIPINADCVAVLHRMIDRVGAGRLLVQLHPSRLTDNFRAARKKAELPVSITFHSRRHTFLSWGAAARWDLPTAQSLIGHRSNEATQIYLHAYDENKRSAIERLTLPRKAASS